MRKTMTKKSTLLFLVDFFLILSVFTRQLYINIPNVISYLLLGGFLLLSLCSALVLGFDYIILKPKIVLPVFSISVITSLMLLKFTGDPYLLIMILYSTTLLKNNINTRLKNLFMVGLVFFIFIVILSINNIIPMNREPIFYDIKFGLGEKISLGFITANYAFLIFNLLVFLYAKISGKFSIFKIIFLTLLSLLMFYYTRSRTGFIVSIFFILTYNMFMAFKNTKNFSTFFAIFSILISFALGFNVLGLGSRLNNILNGRPLMWNYYLSQGISIFGMELHDYIYLDNYFIFLFCRGGIILFLLFVPIYLLSISKIKNRSIQTILISINLYFLFENCFKIFLPFVSLIFVDYIYYLSVHKKTVKRRVSYENRVPVKLHQPSSNWSE